MKTPKSLRLFANVRMLAMTFIKHHRSNLWVLALMLTWVASPVVWAAEPVVVNQDIPLGATVQVLLPGGQWDDVTLSGMVHTLVWITRDAQTGDCLVRFHANADGVQGVGTSGLKYLLTGARAVVFPPSPCSPSMEHSFIFTLNAADANSEFPPSPCDITFSITSVENEISAVTVSIEKVAVLYIGE